MSAIQKLRIAKEFSSYKKNKEDIASFVMSDLENEGYDVRLEKDGRRWHIVPIKELSPEELERFNILKDQKTKERVAERLEHLRLLRKSLL